MHVEESHARTWLNLGLWVIRSLDNAEDRSICMAELIARLDGMKLRPFHYKILMVSGLGWAFDSMDTGIIAFLMPRLIHEWGLSGTEVGWLGSIGLIGMALGAVTSGTLADVIGRKRVFAWTVFLYSLATALCAVAPNYEWLLIFRFLVGVGLGGELPVAATLMTEYIPTAVRGRFIVILESFWAVGWLLAAAIAYFLVPHTGWRFAFLVGALPALYIGLIRAHLPESVRYLLRKGRIDEARAIVTAIEEEQCPIASHAAVVANQRKRNSKLLSKNNILESNIIEVNKAGSIEKEMKSPCTGVVEKDNNIITTDAKKDGKETITKGPGALWQPSLRRRTVMLWLAWFGIVFSYYGIFMWLPSLVYQQGFSVVKTSEYVFFMTIAQLPGYMCAAWLVEHWGRKYTLSVFLLGSGVASYFFGHAGTVTVLLISGALMSFFNLGAWGVMYAYTPELYPTAIRGLGCGWAAGVGRIGGMVAPMLVGVLLTAQWDMRHIFYVFAAMFVIIAVVVITLGTESKQRSLEQLEHQGA